ncbi:uncharacterized protein LOC131654120 [Vicia villosa]|uniref:uncharacterized protein LOC131654120 n=1 Tax=Vicia villosa TaxID=3911 RepID=UPI00273AF3C3|nr:uncharacterized protein LOC131654120 [Vicia villosa]
MDDIENDAIARYPPNPYAVSHPHNQGYGYQKHPFRNSPYSRPVVNESAEDFNGGNEEDDYRLDGKDDVVDDEEEEDAVDRNRSVRVPLNHVDEDDDVDDDMDGDGDENDDNDQQENQEYGYLKHPMRNNPDPQPFENEGNNDGDEGDEEDEERLVGEDEGDGDEDVDQNNNFQLSRNHADEEDNNDGDGDEDRDRDEDDNDGDEDREENGDNNDGDNDNKQKSYAIMNEDEFEWHPKKQKLKSLMSTYEFAARVPEPSAAASSATKPSFGARNSLSEWTEKETFVLLDAWGDRFLQHGRKSLRSDEWQQVAEKVSEVSKVDRTDTQCRNRLDTLKKKYKKDKIKFSEMGGGDKKWVYFKKMDKLMSSPPQQAGFSCGLDSRESVFLKPRVFANHANGLDDTRDNPANTKSIGVEGLERPRAKKRRKGRGSDESSSFKLLADSIQNFGKIYEKIENNKRQQMMELEKMRMDFLTELETQKREIFEKLQSEILRFEQRDD